MPDDPDSPPSSSDLPAAEALIASLTTVAWTFVSSTLAVIIGVQTHGAVFVAFGAVGSVDAIGSIALAHHFYHARRHEQLSERLEWIAHRIVLVGLLTVGCVATAGGLFRLRSSDVPHPSDSALFLAGASIFVLAALSFWKRQVAARIHSKALRSDAHLSAVGAGLAVVTLVGVAATRWLGWMWADPAATSLVGVIAVWLSVSTWAQEHQDNSASPK